MALLTNESNNNHTPYMKLGKLPSYSLIYQASIAQD